MQQLQQQASVREGSSEARHGRGISDEVIRSLLRDFDTKTSLERPHTRRSYNEADFIDAVHLVPSSFAAGLEEAEAVPEEERMLQTERGGHRAPPHAHQHYSLPPPTSLNVAAAMRDISPPAERGAAALAHGVAQEEDSVDALLRSFDPHADETIGDAPAPAPALPLRRRRRPAQLLPPPNEPSSSGSIHGPSRPSRAVLLNRYNTTPRHLRCNPVELHAQRRQEWGEANFLSGGSISRARVAPPLSPGAATQQSRRHRQCVPNTFVVPTSKRRDDVRWESK